MLSRYNGVMNPSHQGAVAGSGEDVAGEPAFASVGCAAPGLADVRIVDDDGDAVTCGGIEFGGVVGEADDGRGAVVREVADGDPAVPVRGEDECEPGAWVIGGADVDVVSPAEPDGASGRRLVGAGQGGAAHGRVLSVQG